jgi:hypothetical protein
LQPFKILDSEEESYRAVVQYKGTIDLEGVVDRMTERTSTTSKEDTMAIYMGITATIERLILDGWRVVTPNANHGVSIKGTFNRLTDSLDGTQHRIVATTTPGVVLRRGIPKKAQAQKIKTASLPAPTPFELTNWNNGAGNDTLTPGGLHTLNGDLLKYDLADPAQGIFIVPVNGGGPLDPEQVVRVEVVNRNTSQEISFLAPAELPAGEYSLEVRSTLGQSSLRTGKYIRPVTVA